MYLLHLSDFTICQIVNEILQYIQVNQFKKICLCSVSRSRIMQYISVALYIYICDLLSMCIYTHKYTYKQHECLLFLKNWDILITFSLSSYLFQTHTYTPKYTHTHWYFTSKYFQDYLKIFHFKFMFTETTHWKNFGKI